MTLDDVASAAGVSPKTVSRVLNNEPNVRAKTREKVLAAAEQLGYRPNQAARSLASARSYTIAHLHDNPDQDYISRANAGIYRACREHNYLLFPEPFENHDQNTEARIEAFLHTSRVDGIILTPPLTDYKPLIDLLVEKGVPIVAISPDAEQENMSSVAIDEREAAAVMARHLIDLGHTKIGFIAGPPEHGAAAARGEGFSEAIRSAALDLRECVWEQGDFSLRSGLEAATRLLSVDSQPTAIFAANDAMAAGAMTAAFKLGLSIPEDVSIAGFDASHIGSIVWPPLSTVRQPISQMAETAAQWLITGDLETGSKPLRKVFDFELVRRPSTGAVAKLQD